MESSRVFRLDGPTMSTPQEHLRREGESDQGRVTAVTAAHDRHPVPGRRSFLVHRPADDVDQVVVHLARPLPVAGVHERLAEAVGSAVVDRDHRVAATREKLVDGMVTPGVPRPGTAVDQQHRRQRFPRALRVIRGGAYRQAEVDHDVELVARPDDRGVHSSERVPLQLGSAGEQVREAAGLAVVPVVRLGPVVAVAGDDPPPLIQRAGD